MIKDAVGEGEDEDRYAPEELRNDLAYSERIGESVNDWWERAHATQHLGWLAGYRGIEVWRYLEIDKRLERDRKVLNIGVGLGYCTRELASRGLVVHALDISMAALQSVRDVAVCWTPANITQLPSDWFDIAISNLVTQHMSDEDLITQLREVCRSLKEDGILAIQFSQDIDDRFVADQSSTKQKSGAVLRTTEQFTQVVTCASGKVLRLWIGPSYAKYRSRWAFAHVGKS